MFLPLIATFRESLEIFLIIVPMIIYVMKIGRKDFVKSILSGAVAGLGACFGIGTTLALKVATMDAGTLAFFQASSKIFIAVLILYCIVALQKINNNFKVDKTSEPQMKITGVSLFMIPFITVLREGLEVIVFILPSFATNNPLLLVLFILLGIAGAGVIAYLVFRTSRNININVVFTILSVLLIVIGAIAFGEGLAYFMPDMGKSIEVGGKLLYGIPLLLIYAKKELKRYVKKF